jgi:hypothetical protein
MILSFRIEPKANFASSKSSSSQALASVLGGGFSSSKEEPSKAPSPKPGLWSLANLLASSLTRIFSEHLRQFFCRISAFYQCLA